ncbi:unnamed protein product [Caenorhabditis brenneri]
MEGESNEDQARLIAEREEILRQLELLGEESDIEDPNEEIKEQQDMEPTNEDFEEEKNVFKAEVDDEVEYSQSFAEEMKYQDDINDDSSNANDVEFDPTDFEDEKSRSSLPVDEKNSIDLDEDEENTGSDEQTTPGAGECTNFTPTEKIVLNRVDLDRDTPLPEGWTLINHHSGMPVYYHKFTRVVTHSKPYQVEGMIRDHEIPISTIPCLFREIMNKKHADLAIEEEKCPMTYEQKQDFLKISTNEKTLTPDQYREYCERRFEFKKIMVNRYHNTEKKEGKAQQKHLNAILKKRGFDMDYDQLKKRNNPNDVLLSSDTGAVLIDLTPVLNMPTNRKGVSKKPYLLNPMGKTSVAVLNEFVQRLAKGTLIYEVEDTRNVSCPYQATAMLTMRMNLLNEMAGQCKESLVVLSEIAAATGADAVNSVGVPPDHKRFAIGTGVGANKKTARLVAAKDAISKLIPKLRITDEYVCNGVLEEELQKGFEEESRELFKKVKIDSPNLVQMCTRFAIPKPFSLLKDAISRSLRWNGMELIMEKEMVGSGSQFSKVTLKLGEMQAEAEAIGVKQATQMASQLLFKRMHRDLETYGAFLDVYGKLNDKAKLDVAKRQHDQLVRLPDTGNLLEPNLNVLARLAEEMRNVSLIYPPKKFMFGLAQNAMGYSTEQKSACTQTNSDAGPPFPIMNMHPIPPPPMTYHPSYYHQQPPHPSNHVPHFMPPHEYTGYQSPPCYPNISRKRARNEDGPSSTSPYPPSFPHPR